MSEEIWTPSAPLANVIVAFLSVPQSDCPGESWIDLEFVRCPLTAIFWTFLSLVAAMSASVVVTGFSETFITKIQGACGIGNLT